MKLVFFACSVKAYELMNRVRERWISDRPEDTIFCIARCRALGALSEKRSLSECTGEWFDKADGLIFFCAAGIAVRSIAPYVVHKASDPAVVVMDETGKYGISLLSGHVGGANALTERLCRIAGAEPVITTASDREGKFSVDMFAVKHRMAITDWTAAKELEAGILSGEKIGFLTDDREVPGAEQMPGLTEAQGADGLSEIPEDFIIGGDAANCRAGILVSPYRQEKMPFPLTLQLAPKAIALGIGCRRGASERQIRSAAEACLAEAGVLRAAVYTAASIDLKKEEQGLLAFCKHFFAGEVGGQEIPLVTFSAEQLREQTGAFTPSDFVNQITGVDNVCERSAVAVTGGQLIFRKKAYDGVTVALAARGMSLRPAKTSDERDTFGF